MTNGPGSRALTDTPATQCGWPAARAWVIHSVRRGFFSRRTKSTHQTPTTNHRRVFDSATLVANCYRRNATLGLGTLFRRVPNPRLPSRTWGLWSHPSGRPSLFRNSPRRKDLNDSCSCLFAATSPAIWPRRPVSSLFRPRQALLSFQQASMHGPCQSAIAMMPNDGGRHEAGKNEIRTSFPIRRGTSGCASRRLAEFDRV